MAEAEKKDELDIEDILAGVGEDDAPVEDVLGAEDELDALRAERDEFRDRFMRALADAENARKRGERDRKEAEQYGGSKLARDILPVFDNLKRAIDAVDEEQREANKALLEGVELTLRELLNIFGKHGIEPVAPEVGDQFDPQIHQAMFEAPLPGRFHVARASVAPCQGGCVIHTRVKAAPSGRLRREYFDQDEEAFQLGLGRLFQIIEHLKCLTGGQVIRLDVVQHIERG